VLVSNNGAAFVQTERTVAEVQEKVDDAAERLILQIRQQIPFELTVDLAWQNGAPGMIDVWVAPDDGEPTLCISLASAWPSVRILCDGYVFDEVAFSHAADFVSAILNGEAKTRIFGMVNKRVELAVHVDGLAYAEIRPLGDGIRRWEREMLVQDLS
jgi:hypothetical protein